MRVRDAELDVGHGTPAHPQELREGFLTVRRLRKGRILPVHVVSDE